LGIDLICVASLWLNFCWLLHAGDVFTTLDSLLNMHPEFRPLRSLYTKAGLEDEVQALQGDHHSLTVFAPTGAAAG
jgi:hypothetical protein